MLALFSFEIETMASETTLYHFNSANNQPLQMLMESTMLCQHEHANSRK